MINHPEERKQLVSELRYTVGNSLIEFLKNRVDAEKIEKYKPLYTPEATSFKIRSKVLVAKTPSIANLSLFPDWRLYAE